MTSREAILRRRARFLAAAAALATSSATLAANAEDGGPEDAGAASTDAALDPAISDAGDGGGTEAQPQACLCACAVPGNEANVSGAGLAATIGVIAAIRRRKRSFL